MEKSRRRAPSLSSWLGFFLNSEEDFAVKEEEFVIVTFRVLEQVLVVMNWGLRKEWWMENDRKRKEVW